MATTTVKANASYERNTASGYATNWAGYSHDDDCNSYDGGYTTRAGGVNSDKNYNAWYTFPTGTSFLDPAKYTITAASFQIFQPYFGSPNGYSGTGTVRARFGKMTPSGTNGLSASAQTLTIAANPVDGAWYTFSNVLTGAQALQSGTANGIYMDVSDWSSSKWYSRLTYHGGSSYYPRINLTYSSRSYTLTVTGNNCSVSGGGTYTWGTSRTVTCTPNTGYRFSKWQLSGGSTASSTSSSYTFTMPTANTTATATCVANTYTVYYNANGGSGTTASSSHTYGTAKALTSNGFSRTGYTFLGWSTSSTATSATYSNGQSVSNLTSTHGGSVTLYAVWSANKIKLTFNANGGSGGMTNAWYYYGSNNFYSNEACTTKITSITIPTRVGHTFIYYYGDGTCGGTDGERYAGYDSTVFAGDLCTDIYKNATLYAKWEANTYTITYDANGGSGTPDTQTYTYADSGTTNLSATIPSRVGHTFLGWSLSATASVASYSAGHAWGLNNASDYTLYAVWSKNSYVVTVPPVSGASVTGSSAYLYGDTAQLTCTAKAGYRFLHWADTAYNIVSTANPYSFEVDSDITLYAIVELYGVVYISNGALFLSSEVYSAADGAWTRALPHASVDGAWKHSG